MADVDPEKILAELEAARALVRKPERGDLDARLKTLIISVVAIVVLAAGALWILSFVLEGMPHGSHKPPNSAETDTLR